MAPVWAPVAAEGTLHTPLDLKEQEHSAAGLGSDTTMEGRGAWLPPGTWGRDAFFASPSFGQLPGSLAGGPITPVPCLLQENVSHLCPLSPMNCVVLYKWQTGHLSE